MKVRHSPGRWTLLNNYMNVSKKRLYGLMDVSRTNSKLACFLLCASIPIIVFFLLRASMSFRFASNCHNDPLVAFSLPGLAVSVHCALNLNIPLFPAEMRLEEKMKSPTLPPQNAILRSVPRLLIAVTTGCCQQILMDRRNAIRATWIATMRENLMADVDVLFFIAQAPNMSLFEEWVPAIEVVFYSPH